MKLRLKYLLQPIGKTDIKFRIYEMDECFRCATVPRVFKCNNGNEIISNWQPEINGEKIYLYGRSRQRDNIECNIQCKNQFARDQRIAEINAALKEWSIKYFAK